MKVIVGLGNPGKKYAGTPHNVGFAVIDELADRWSCKLRRSLRFRARTGKTGGGSEALLLVKPDTYMNRSGDAVGVILRYWKLGPESLILVLDDADLEIGRMRVRPRGSSGGHRGLESVIQSIGSDDFVRVRLGIGRGRGSRDLISHVLSPFSQDERQRVDEEIVRASDAVGCILDAGVDAAMNAFNKRPNKET